MIAHSLFNLLGVLGGDVDAARALLVLLLLSVYWQPVRGRVVALLDDAGHRLPPVQFAP